MVYVSCEVCGFSSIKNKVGDKCPECKKGIFYIPKAPNKKNVTFSRCTPDGLVSVLQNILALCYNDSMEDCHKIIVIKTALLERELFGDKK